MDFDVVARLAGGSAVEAWLTQKAGEASRVVLISRPEVQGDPAVARRFQDSVRSALQFEHPALLSPTKWAWLADGRLELTTSPVNGRTVRDVLDTVGSLPAELVVRWGTTVCDALTSLHARGQVHGCLSPRHLFLVGDETHLDVKLLDTSLLLFRGPRSVAVPTALVAPEYLAPERVARRRGTASSDIYGLGVLLYELFTGRPPYKGKTDGDTRMQHLRSPLPLFRGPLGRYEGVLGRCLAKKAAERFSDAQAVRRALLEA